MTTDMPGALPAVAAPLASPTHRRYSSAAPVFCVTLLLVYLGTTGSLPFLGRDEPRYVQVAREMWSRGDWVTPTLGGFHWFEKPALLYWLMMASFTLFGVAEWSARLAPALCGLGTVGLVFWVARRVRPDWAFWSAVSLASSGGLLAFSHGATFDIVLLFTVTLSVAGFLIAELEGNEPGRTRYLALFWIGIGLSLLAKGLVGFVLPVGIACLYFALRGEWRGFSRMGAAWGVPLASLVAATWYGPVIARHGRPFINEFFIQHHFARYLSDKYHHHQPFYFYGPVLLLLALPWTAYLLASLPKVMPSTWRAPDRDSRLRVLALAWLAVPIGFFSLSGSKLPSYILPALPGAMLLAGEGIASYISAENGLKRTRLSGALLSALAVGIFLYARRAGMAEAGLLVAAPLMLAGLMALLQTRHRHACVWGIVGSMLFATAMLGTVVGKPLAEGDSVQRLVEEAAWRGCGSLPLAQMGTMQRSAQFYAAGHLLYGPDGEPLEYRSAGQFAKANHGRTLLLLTPLSRVAELTSCAQLQTRTIGNNGEVALLLVSAN